MVYNGIREPSGDFTVVVGTSRILTTDYEPEQRSKDDEEGTKTKKKVLLSPNPSDDPNDPLHWPIWHRDVILLIIGLFSFLCGGLVALLAAAMGVVQRALNQSPVLTTIGVNGMCMVGLAVGNLTLGPLSRIYAKRPVYLCAIPVLFAGIIWCANANKYYALAMSRLFQGIGGSPSEFLVSATIGEIYFAHERGLRLAVYTLLYLGGKNLWPMISGFIVSDLKNWHWVFWIASIVAGALWILIFVFVHETTFSRAHLVATPKCEKGELQSQKPDQPRVHAKARMRKPSRTSITVTVEPVAAQKKPFVQGLRVYSGRKTSESFPRLFIRPLILYAYLPVLYSAILYSTSIAWLSVIAETISSIFSAAPYHFSQKSVGLMYIALFVGGSLGSAGGGKLTEVVVTRMTRRNGGWYEPEFRLLMMPLVMLTMSIGLIGFGWSAYDGCHAIVPAIFLGVLGFGTSLSCTLAIQYVLDCFRDLTTECLIALNLLENIVGFVFSCFVPQFLHAAGDRTAFLVYGCVCLALCTMTWPMYVYGKICRRYSELHDWVGVKRFKEGINKMAQH